MAGFETIQNSKVKEEVARYDGDIEKYYSHQKTMSAIKDFQNIAKMANTITGLADMVCKCQFNEYSKSLAELKQINDESKTLNEYINVENAEELDTLLSQIVTLSTMISESKFAAFSTDANVKSIIKKPVKVRVTEKIIPKFTTIEYD